MLLSISLVLYACRNVILFSPLSAALSVALTRVFMSKEQCVRCRGFSSEDCRFKPADACPG